MSQIIQNIPTNVITGFLGVGKTTAILHLLQNKPENERWAVLVNEFGQIGIDGQILQQDDVTIKELPGGCMCCAAGLSVQVGINKLLANSKPDRLLIEPTGIGHPGQIIRQLSQPPFDSVLNMQACITLIDPRQLKDSRYTDNEYYKEQLDIADVLVANKIDQCSDEEITLFDQLVETRHPATSGKVSQGQVDTHWLSLPHPQRQKPSLLQSPASPSDTEEPDPLSLADGESCRRQENENAGFFSCGWLFSDQLQFDFDKLTALFDALEAERIKAVLKTNLGNTVFNVDTRAMTHTPNEHTTQNRVEIIRREETDWEKIEQALLACQIQH